MEAPNFKRHELSELERDASKVYSYDAFNHIEKAFLNLLDNEEFKGRIESGYYDLLLSDEKSGRIPTLILRKLADRISDKKLRTFFIASGQLPHEKETRYGHQLDIVDEKINMRTEKQYENDIAEHLKKIAGNTSEQKALIMTEFIDSGGSMRHLVKAAQAAGIEVDVATLAARENFNNHDQSYLYEQIGLADWNSDQDPPQVYNAETNVEDLNERADFFHPFHEKQLEPYRPTVRRNAKPDRKFSTEEKAVMLQEVFPEGKDGFEFIAFNQGYSTGDDETDRAIEAFLEDEKKRPYSEEEIKILREREEMVNKDIDLLVARLLE